MTPHPFLIQHYNAVSTLVKKYNEHSNTGLGAAHSQTGQSALVANEQVSRSFVTAEEGPIHRPTEPQPE